MFVKILSQPDHMLSRLQVKGSLTCCRFLELQFKSFFSYDWLVGSCRHLTSCTQSMNVLIWIFHWSELSGATVWCHSMHWHSYCQFRQTSWAESVGEVWRCYLLRLSKTLTEEYSTCCCHMIWRWHVLFFTGCPAFLLNWRISQIVEMPRICFTYLRTVSVLHTVNVPHI